MKKKGTAFTLVEMLVVIAIIGILMALLLPVVGKVRANANASKCNSNLKNIAVGVSAYADDHNGFLPAVQPTGYTNMVALLASGKYLPNASTNKETVWLCPSDDRTMDIPISYGINLTYILGTNIGLTISNPIPMDRITKPSGTIWMGDSGQSAQYQATIAEGAPPTGVEFRHLGRSREQSVAYKDVQDILDQDGSANFLFYDGHVEGLRYEELTTSMWEGN